MSKTRRLSSVGDEGMLGMSAFSGGTAMLGESMLQVRRRRPDEMTAERMTVAAFRREISRHGALHDCINRYSRGMIALMMQSTACMALHAVQQRCCRWLLMTHDRIRSDAFTLSQDLLAMMLGSTRPTVTVGARGLQQKGHPRCPRPHDHPDRSGLEAASWEGYAAIKAKFDRLGL